MVSGFIATWRRNISSRTVKPRRWENSGGGEKIDCEKSAVRAMIVVDVSMIITSILVDAVVYSISIA